MLVRLLFWIDSIFILINVNHGYIRTYADDYYGRIRGSNQITDANAAIIFLIVFGCIIGGFFIFCILGTFILGFFDNGFRCPHRNILSNSNINSFTTTMNSHL